VNNVVKNLVYSGNPGNVRLTMIAGKVLYENGLFFVGEDPEQVYREAQQWTKKIVESV
jgi:5-methylthioadenosine/S-adenosylhomocysteine deaminase